MSLGKSAENKGMQNTSPHQNLAVTLREAMGPGFHFNSGTAFEKFASRVPQQPRQG